MSQTHEITTLPDGSLISCIGEIDYSYSPELRQIFRQVLDTKPQRLIIDLQGVAYMDSSGVAVLVEALQTQTKAKRQLFLCNLQTKVRGIFEIARLDMVFKIKDSVEDAKQA
ncbi:STAS domain-containing protein [bacterium AH-315-I18]|nr:STAS domain-containing protein [Phycisphaeraceae bacterium]MBN4061029.1 STAS domain-containing protein [bacterium AH-315-I18]